LTIAKKNKIKISNKNKIQFVTDRPGHDKRYAVNSNKIKREIKWKNKTSISSGLLKTFTWYSKNLNFFKKISRKNITKRFGLKV
jgi:dTDP-glucose 4,6-dehydratase